MFVGAIVCRAIYYNLPRPNNVLVNIDRLIRWFILDH